MDLKRSLEFYFTLAFILNNRIYSRCCINHA